ncbi:S1 RNA-binding domain-containing protein [Neosynechococcus sphagnicola]|uniref:S1 RNA-binding domain-containing protein n=1 Tax=Neosynechococcus sphagnicola TaxID=1501145 RepID=UPI001EF9D946|nr:S1 RNA-binding domain-containing protein [Neosynechococcus sphagnicola]
MTSKSARSRETAASFSMEDFARALEQHDYHFPTGQMVTGKVYSYESDGAYVDIGAKSLAYLPAAEVALNPNVKVTEILPLQSEQEFMIIREQDAEGQVTLSRKRMEILQVWEQLKQMQENNQTLSVRVTGLNKGGVTVATRGLRGFIPRSHLVARENLEALKGQTLTVGFLEVDSERGKLVLSQRQAARSASVSQFEVGQLIDGKVASIKPFGLFIDFEGTTGLLHINQISNQFVRSLPELFQLGQPLQAVIVDRDEAKGRIALSTKVLENYPR